MTPKRTSLRLLLGLTAVLVISFLAAPAAHAGPLPPLGSEIQVTLIPSPLNPDGDDPVQDLDIVPVQQCVLVSVVDEFFFPVPNADVRVIVFGANAVGRVIPATTDENGEAEVCYFALFPGTDLITASLVADPSVVAEVEKTWTVPPLVGLSVLQASASGNLKTRAGRLPFFASATSKNGVFGGSAGFNVGPQNGLPGFRFTVPQGSGFGVTGVMAENSVVVLLGRGLVYLLSQPRNPLPVTFRIELLRFPGQGNSALVNIFLNAPLSPFFTVLNGQLQQGVVSIRAR